MVEAFGNAQATWAPRSTGMGISPTTDRSQKASGAYYTPDPVVSTLVKWAVRNETDRLLDPSCGDGRFIAAHRNSVGIEDDPRAVRTALARAPSAVVHAGDFFSWASNTEERFECVAGNPPFIRYQTFKGAVRHRALTLCAGLGAQFSGLASSWAPFLVVAASLLKGGGRMAFVVPAEIGHAPYAAPLLEYLVDNFRLVQIIAVQGKLFPELSEDCWLLYADGFGGSTDEIRFTPLHHFFTAPRPPRICVHVGLTEWRAWKRRLRPFLLSAHIRENYRTVADHPTARRLGDIARVGIGYVSGANDFFHLRRTTAEKWGIPRKLLHPTVRNGRALPPRKLTGAIVERWKRADEPILLLRLPREAKLPDAVLRYLATDDALAAREAYKCRNRDPWYSVPDVQFPDFFLTYMSGRSVSLVRNEAGCTCTNSVHSVRLRSPQFAGALSAAWNSPFVQLSCELEGHPLGGGMLKLEPGEASQVVLPTRDELDQMPTNAISEAINTMHAWRHYGR